MGGISHLFDSKKTSRSRKSSHKKHGDGFEAPRNSLELSIEASKGRRRAIQEKVPYQYNYQVEQQPKVNFSADGASMKKLIDEEVSKRSNENQSAPSVVARLMGMNSLPTEINTRVQAKEHEVQDLRNTISRNQPIRNNISRKQLMEKDIIKNDTYASLRASGKQARETFLLNDDKLVSKSHKTRKPQPRKHPQEDLLQKFKKDFEAWQASRLLEDEGVHKSYTLREGKDCQTIAQENLNKEKMARYLDIKKTLAEKKPMEPKGVAASNKLITDRQQVVAASNKLITDRQQVVAASNKLITDRQQVVAASNKLDTDRWQGVAADTDRRQGCEPLHVTSKELDDTTMKNGGKIKDIEHFPATRIDKKHERLSSSTRIVILKPNMERSDGSQVSLAGTSDTSGKECSMEDFLQEVKERLQMELHGKTRSNQDRDSRSLTLFDDRSTDPKQIARDIAKQIRESVTKDIGTTLMRSESTRSYRSEGQINGLDSPEFIRRDTRKLISERLKNVLRKEAVLDKIVVKRDRSEASILVKDKVTTNFTSGVLNKEKNLSYWEDKKAVSESISNHRQESSVVPNAEAVSPPNLVRSFSAPVSGTAFGKLLLEDQSMLTGAQIRRKHEVSDLTREGVMRNRKDNITFKGRVSNIKNNFNLKGKLFGKKSHLVEDSAAGGFSPVKPIPSVPTAFSNISFAQENSTEVPPSPASASSSSQDEFAKPDNPSPISPLEVPLIEDRRPSPRASREISSRVPELHLPEQIEHAESEAAVEEKPNEHVDDESRDAAYLRDILVTAGFYEDKSPNQTNSRWDALTRPISNQVFQEVEEAYNKYGYMDTEDDSLGHNDDTIIEHKLLFDLVNEGLQSVLTPKINCSIFRRWVLGPAAMPKGKGLLDDLWNQIQLYLHPPADEFYNIDIMVAREVRMTTLPSELYEDIDVVGRQIERVILRDLIEDFVRDIRCQ